MASAADLVYSGNSSILPTLEVVKTVPIMAITLNIDWLLHIYFARRDFQRCKKLIERELYKHLNPEYLYFIKGLIDREEGNNIEALRNLQKALEMNSKNIEIYKEIGKTLFIMGRYNQSLDVFREAEQLSTRLDHEIFHFIGELLLRSAAARNQVEMARKEELEAKAYFQKALQTGKKLESFQRLAEIHRKEKEYYKAIEVLENCLILCPENTEVLTEIGVLYLKLNDSQKAFDRLLEVIQFDRKCLRGLMAFGAILQSRNDVDAALGKYKQIAALEPDIAELWNNIGLCFFKKQKLIVSISSLRKAIWLSPLNYNALYNLSLIYITAQQYASAFHTLAAAINLRKDNAECYMLLGICLRKLEDFDNAFTAFERASAIASKQTTATTTAPASKLSSSASHPDATASTAAAATATTQGNPLIHLNFALFCYETGRLAVAKEQYQRFVNYAQDLMLLPTEYKFHATKLKSLLKISSSHILSTEQTNNTDDKNLKGFSSISDSAAAAAAAGRAGGGDDIATVVNLSNLKVVDGDFPVYSTTAKTITNNTTEIIPSNNYANANRDGSSNKLLYNVVPNDDAADNANCIARNTDALASNGDDDDGDDITATDLRMQNMPLEVNAVVN